jgi:GTP 3',8-cyclase
MKRSMLLDRLDRPLASLRVSVTDRCNLRCSYCMPEADYVWLPRSDVLSFEEIGRLVDLFGRLGVSRLRLTGGEPLLRRNLVELVRQLATRPHVRDLALTTNGLLLADQARALRGAGLHRLTLSLDTLRAERFRALTRHDGHDAALRGLDAAAEAGFKGLKIDTVVMRGINEDEMVHLLEHGRARGAEVRFIEYMDVGGATRWSMEAVVSRAEMLEALGRHYGPIEAMVEDTSAPAARFRLPDGATFGIISSTTEPFCRRCDRARLTADGVWLLCLYATRGLDLRALLREGLPDDTILERITTAWQARDDRGAEERLETDRRATLIPVDELRRQPHLEMHTRGG